MPVERRGQVTDVEIESTGNRRSSISRRKAAAFKRWHEPEKSRGLRPVVCPGKAGMFSRKKAYRGNSQKPRSLDSRVAGNQDSEAYRQGLPGGDHESPGRNESERECGLENKWIRGPSPQPEGEGSMGSRKLNDAATSPRRGGMRQHGDKDMLSNWRSPPRPAEKSAEQGRSYNRLNREIDRRREGGGWARSSDEAE